MAEGHAVHGIAHRLSQAGWIVTDDRQLAAARGVLIAGGTVPRWPKVYAVYGRNGQPCRVCGSPVRAQAHSQQRVYWCPTCQPALTLPVA